MGTTGSSENVAMNNALPDIISRVREYATVPVAVGFGVATRKHFNVVANAGADGVVIGSRLVKVIRDAPKGLIAESVEQYCQDISASDAPSSPPVSQEMSSLPAERSEIINEPGSESILPARFGQFGGQYVPEALYDCLVELEQAHNAAINDPKFWEEFESFFGYMNRPSKLYYAEKLTEHAGGAKIWLKREDL